MFSKLFCRHPQADLQFVRPMMAGEKQYGAWGYFYHCLKCGKTILVKKAPAGGKVLFSVDTETDGLYGKSFAIAVTVRYLGQEVAKFVGRAPYTSSNQWVKDNVLPTLEGVPENFSSSEELEEAFWSFWLQNKKYLGEDTMVIAHCGSPVESGLFRRCVERDLANRQWDGPYPAIHDVATLLSLLGEKPDSVDTYVSKYPAVNIPEGKTHNPYYDAAVAALVWEHAWNRLLEKTS